MRSNLLNNIIFISLIGCVSCATSPPELPPDYGSTRPTHTIDSALFSTEDIKKTCDEINVEHDQLNNALNNIDKNIENNRTSDQTVAYLLGPVFTLFDTNSDVKEKRIAIHKRIDSINLLRRYKKCN